MAFYNNIIIHDSWWDSLDHRHSNELSHRVVSKTFSSMITLLMKFYKWHSVRKIQFRDSSSDGAHVGRGDKSI